MLSRSLGAHVGRGFPGRMGIFDYRNPVMRVGDDYWLATSTFEYLPGIVIRHSTDLVN